MIIISQIIVSERRQLICVMNIQKQLYYQVVITLTLLAPNVKRIK